MYDRKGEKKNSFVLHYYETITQNIPHPMPAFSAPLPPPVFCCYCRVGNSKEQQINHSLLPSHFPSFPESS